MLTNLVLFGKYPTYALDKILKSCDFWCRNKEVTFFYEGKERINPIFP
jgi:hypothetical protein